MIEFIKYTVSNGFFTFIGCYIIFYLLLNTIYRSIQYIINTIYDKPNDDNDDLYNFFD